MSPSLFRYGLASPDAQSLTPEQQAVVTRSEFLRKSAAGELPGGIVDAGFVADTIGGHAVKFLHRPMGIDIAIRCRPGDRICVSSYDRLITSHADASETLEWAIRNQVGLIFIEQAIDSTTPEGAAVLKAMTSLKRVELAASSRRAQVRADARRAAGVPNGTAPLGYQIKTIIPISGRRRKYLFPWEAERQYGQEIVRLHDVCGLSYEKIAVRLWKTKRVSPRSGNSPYDQMGVLRYYRACKGGWRLPGGVQWKPPSFQYKLAARDLVIDLNACSA